MFKFTLVNTPIRDSTTNAVVPPQEIEETQDDYRLDKDDFFESLAAFQPQQSRGKEVSHKFLIGATAEKQTQTFIN